ncbi:MAG: STAS domain-containing protein [Chloroflexi bacterium]|jgi:anti-anti-sigma factor|nr:STAS domain-containing protein [Chloroflexota bacterium]
MDWASSLQIRTSEAQGRVPVTVLHVEGRINMSNTDALEQAASAAIDQGARYLLLDLSSVPSLTSAGLRSIHLIYQQLNQPDPTSQADPAAAEASKRLKLLVTSPDVRKVLQISGFDSYLEVYSSLQKAIASF